MKLISTTYPNTHLNEAEWKRKMQNVFYTEENLLYVQGSPASAINPGGPCGPKQNIKGELWFEGSNIIGRMD